MAHGFFCAPQMEGSAFQPESSGITHPVLLNGDLSTGRMLFVLAPSPPLRGRESVVLYIPAQGTDPKFSAPSAS